MKLFINMHFQLVCFTELTVIGRILKLLSLPFPTEATPMPMLSYVTIGNVFV